MNANALLYCTFNGVANCTNGIGRQTRTFLSVLRRHHARLSRELGPFTPYLAFPEPGPDTWNYEPHRLRRTRAVVEALGGDVIPLPYDTRRGLWHTATWRRLCAEAARVVADLASRHSRVLAIGIDTPFAGLARSALDRGLPDNAEILLAMFSTARVVEHPEPDPGRVAWEHDGLHVAHDDRRVHVADIGVFLSRHLVTAYGVDADRLVSWPSGLDLHARDLRPPTPAEARAHAARFGVPTDRPLVATIARTDPTKGVDLLIDALAPLRDDAHLAAIVVPSPGQDALLADYRSRIASAGLRATVVDRFTRALPRALAALPTTYAMACPSRGETLANVVFETALWARHGGAVVVAPASHGFPEQITHRSNGLLYDPTDPGALTTALSQALDLPDHERATLRRAAFARVHAERDASAHLAALLRRFWPPSSPARR
ncbi:glycosyltransferase family 4 protein [Streptomyces sp. 4N509B]|uniref:glycosyltransferase family 4 protein n=1 Tax=Streptomyces sp. 4N509B TaxID=3457413 RepID=UPI003FD0EB60